MLDIVFAMLAAGMNAVPEPSDTAQAGTGGSYQVAPDTVTAGEGVVIGGSNAATASVAAVPAVPAQPATPATPAVPATPSTAVAASGPTQNFNMAVVPQGLLADPQTPSGKFTTATEIKPILAATKGNWVAVRDYDGKDWLYVTHLWSWRCGLAAMAISVNGETMQNWPMPPCHEQFTTPNALLEDDALPVLTFRQGSVQTITIQIVYDDLTMDMATFERGNVLIP